MSSGQRFVAFLRGMNLGRRRITNEELCAHVTALGFANVTAFLASGNVIFDARSKSAAKVATTIESGLSAALAYDVPTFLRSAAEVRAIADHRPFANTGGEDGGKLQVALLHGAPTAAARKKILAHATASDQLALTGRELYWLPRGKMTDAELDLAAIEKLSGPISIRTHRTLLRIVAKFLTA